MLARLFFIHSLPPRVPISTLNWSPTPSFHCSFSTIQSSSFIQSFLLILHLNPLLNRHDLFSTPSVGHCPVNKPSWEEVLSKVTLVFIVNTVSLGLMHTLWRALKREPVKWSTLCNEVQWGEILQENPLKFFKIAGETGQRKVHWIQKGNEIWSWPAEVDEK